MDGRFAKILIFVLCGAFLLIAGCTAPAPSGGAAPTPAATGPVSTSAADLGTITTLLQAMSAQISLIAENTRPEARGYETGNIVLFDNMGNSDNTLPSGTALVALPQGKCEVAVFARSVGLFVTLEEEKDMEIGRERTYRNRQTCLNDPMCRVTVQLDDNYSFLYIEYKPYYSSNSLSQVTLSYRCR
jgi:hypothetical protein